MKFWSHFWLGWTSRLRFGGFFFSIIAKLHFRTFSKCSQKLPFICAKSEKSSPSSERVECSPNARNSFPFPLQSLNTSLISLSSPALQADTAPTSESLQQTLYQKASWSTGTIFCILGVTSFIPCAIFQMREDPTYPKSLCIDLSKLSGLLKRENNQNEWEHILGRKNLLGIQGTKEITGVLNKKIGRYFSISESPYSFSVWS